MPSPGLVRVRLAYIGMRNPPVAVAEFDLRINDHKPTLTATVRCPPSRVPGPGPLGHGQTSEVEALKH